MTAEELAEIEERHQKNLDLAPDADLCPFAYKSAREDRGKLLAHFRASRASDWTWFWNIVDRHGPQGLPSCEVAALRILINSYRASQTPPQVTLGRIVEMLETFECDYYGQKSDIAEAFLALLAEKPVSTATPLAEADVLKILVASRKKTLGFDPGAGSTKVEADQAKALYEATCENVERDQARAFVERLSASPSSPKGEA